jgi:hypothetical protein
VLQHWTKIPNKVQQIPGTLQIGWIQKFDKILVQRKRPGVNFTNILLAQLRQYSCANKKLTFTASTKNLRAKLSYEKGARKMLVKLTPSSPKKRQSRKITFLCLILSKIIYWRITLKLVSINLQRLSNYSFKLIFLKFGLEIQADKETILKGLEIIFNYFTVLKITSSDPR